MINVFVPILEPLQVIFKNIKYMDYGELVALNQIAGSFPHCSSI